MTNLEYLVTRESIDNSGTLCILAYMCKHKHSCKDVNCSDCEFRKDTELCVQVLLEEHKETIKLMLHEKCILESLPNDYKYIARDENGDLGIYKHEPLKCRSVWIPQAAHNGLRVLELFNHLFKFIKWEDNEPYKIEDILNNCEVGENVD